MPDLGVCADEHLPPSPNQGLGKQESAADARDRLPKLLRALELWLSLYLCTDYAQHKKDSLELPRQDVEHKYPLTQ